MHQSVAFALAAALTLASAAAAQTAPASAAPPQTALSTAASPRPAAEPRTGEEGRPLVRVYRPLEVGGGAQTWALAQDERGTIFATTNGALLEFDGATWRRHVPVYAAGSVRSLAFDHDRIYVGSAPELGYFEPDSSGALKFVRLERPPGVEFNDVWRVFPQSDGIWFQTETALLRWADGKFTTVRAKSRFNRSSLVDGRIYLTTPETGLNVLEQGALKMLPGTESLSSEPFPLILRYDAQRLLIGTRRNGFFLYDGATLTRFATEFEPELRAAALYRGVSLPDGTFVICTTGSGVFIMDHDGRRVMAINRANGLPSDTVYFAMRDREGALWLGLDNGIARVETPSPLSYLDEHDGIVSQVQAMVRIQGRLMIGTGTGAGYLEPAADPTKLPRVRPIQGPSTQCWAFALMPDSAGRVPPAVVAACGDGLHEIRGDTSLGIRVPSDLSYRPNALLQSRLDPTRLWIGLFDGLASFRFVGGRWIDEQRVPGTLAQIRSLVEEDDGSIWAGTQTDGLLRFTPETPPTSSVPRPTLRVEQFGENSGLPPGGVSALRVGGHSYFAVGIDDPEIMRFDPSTRRFSIIRELSHVIGVNPVFGGGSTVVDESGRLFLNYGRDTAVVTRRADGTFDVDKKTFSRLGNTLINGVAPDGPHTAWVQMFDGRVLRFDAKRALASAPPLPPTVVRRVATIRGETLYGGMGAAGGEIRLPSESNSLRFEFAAPSFLDEAATEYQTRLDGFDDDWSPWSHDARRDITNLAPGHYRFRVRGRIVTGALTREAEYGFVVLPPWYRTWWAYAAYLAIAVLAIAGASSLLRRRVVARERARADAAATSLRAAAAEELAKSEQEGKRNVELLSEIGREITASLDFDTIFGKLYERVNELTDADIFGVGLYHPERQEIEYRLAIEAGKRYAPYTRTTTDRNQLPVWCIEHREAVFINDVASEYQRYVSAYEDPSVPLEDGSLSREPQSIIYLPLLAKDRVLGIITIQSFEKHAYTEHHLNVMKSLAAYTAVALDNASAYRQLNEHELEIRRLFEEAQRARAAAEDADAAKSAFLSTVSHELRTPLTSVLGFAKIIRKRLEDRIFPAVTSNEPRVQQSIRQVDDNLKVVISEGERLTKLIDDVLDLAKIEAGKLEWHMESIDVGEVIDQATAATSSLFDQKGLRLVKEVAAGLPPVTGDHDRLVQVVINLISNAVKFTDTGSITCRVERRGGEVAVSVIDTGVGIAPADHPKVFERFKQVGDTLTDKPKGTGLGLPICREIVEHHGGRIWVESEPGRGSTFAFTLPTGADAAASAHEPVALAALIRQLREQVIVTAPRTAERQPRILVVDDDEHIRSLLRQELTEEGYQVQLATNGREGLALVRRERPDLVVLDVMMPEMNGFDVAAVLKNDPQTMDVPILILSIVQDRERGFRLGVDRYLTKPIDTDLLFKEVDALIEQKKSRRHVLVVDDDATTTQTLSDVLAARGYRVSKARGEDLVAQAIAVQPDIIMLSSGSSAQSDAVQTLRFERGMENVLLLVYQ